MLLNYIYIYELFIFLKHYMIWALGYKFGGKRILGAMNNYWEEGQLLMLATTPNDSF